jgi:hypothetical protein
MSLLYAEISGHVAVGRYVLQVGQPFGALIGEGSSSRTHIRTRPTPVLSPVPLVRGVVGRGSELAAALSPLDSRLPIEINGPSGIGKTALLGHVAYEARPAAYPDGIVWIEARHQTADDVLQLIFEAFYESDAICKATEAETRRSLRDKRALILLDAAHLEHHELQRVLELAPKSAFAIATTDPCLVRDVRHLALSGLPGDHGAALFERYIERPLELSERQAVAGLCAALDGHPLRIQQAAAVVRTAAIPLDGWARVTPTSVLTELLASLDEKQHRAALALTALPGVPLDSHHIAAIAELIDIEPALSMLVRSGVVVTERSRYRLAAGVCDRLRRTDDLNPWLNRAITYFTAWAERHRRNANTLLDECEALLSVQDRASENRRWGEVLHLGRLLDPALAIGCRFGAWQVALERCVVASKATSDRSSEAWALHQLGSRAVCVGEPAVARAHLHDATAMRRALGDNAGAAASNRTLALVLAPVAEPRKRVTIVTPTAKKGRRGALSLTAFVFAALGWLAVTVVRPPVEHQRTAVSPVPSTDDLSTVPPRSGFDSPTEGSVVPVSADATVDGDQANILIFTARPGSIITARSTELCYAVSGADEVQIQPNIGEVSPGHTLSCLRVAPKRTTTYELTARGRDGNSVRRELVVVVR